LVVSCELMDKLRFDFPGSPPSYLFSRLRNGNDSVLRDTIEANALTYYGASRLTEAAQFQHLTAKVASVFSQIVPSAQTEIPLLQFNAANQAYSPVQSDNGTVSYTTGVAFNSATVLALGNPIYPGTLSIATSGGVLRDDGGQLYADTTVIGVVDYPRGEVRFAATAPTYSGSKTATFRPAGAPLQLADSAGSAVTQESRAFNWQITLDTPPAPGTAFAAYRSGASGTSCATTARAGSRGRTPALAPARELHHQHHRSVSRCFAGCGQHRDLGLGRPGQLHQPGDRCRRAAARVPQVRHGDIAPGTLTIAWNDGSLRTWPTMATASSPGRA